MTNATLSGYQFTYAAWIQNTAYHTVQGIERILKSVANMPKNIRSRRAAAGLLKYDDRMLNDMGLTRGALERALDLPLSVNALAVARKESVAQRVEDKTYWAGSGRGPAGEPHKYFPVLGLIR